MKNIIIKNDTCGMWVIKKRIPDIKNPLFRLLTVNVTREATIEII